MTLHYVNRINARMKRLVVIPTACMLLALGERTAVGGNSVSVKDLRCEYRVNPLGTDEYRIKNIGPNNPE